MCKKFAVLLLFLAYSNLNYCDDSSQHDDSILHVTPKEKPTPNKNITPPLTQFKIISKQIQQVIVWSICTYYLYTSIKNFLKKPDKVIDIIEPLEWGLAISLRWFIATKFHFKTAATMELGISETLFGAKLGHNAYIIPEKNQIVIGKELLLNSNQKELHFVIAHELGHYYNPYGIIAQFILQYPLLSTLGFSLVSRLLLVQCDKALKKAKDIYPASQYPLLSRCINAYHSCKTFCNDNPLLSFIIEQHFMDFLSAAYFRYKEKEADLFAIEKTGKIGYEGAIEFFSKEEPPIGNLSLRDLLQYYLNLPFATHPSHQTRIDYITKYYEAMVKIASISLL